MKLLFKIIIFILLINSLNSCKIRYAKAVEFYNTWEKNSKPISKEEFTDLNLLHKTVYKICEIYLKSANNGKSRLLPNIKYLIIENTIDVVVCDSIIKTTKFNEKLFFEPINSQKANKYIYFPRSIDTEKILLYYNEKYKKILRKRKWFSSESVYGLKKEENIMAIFDGVVYYSIHTDVFKKKPKMQYRDPLFKITSITISKDCKSAILQINYAFGSYKVYYSYKNKHWNTQKFDRWSVN